MIVKINEIKVWRIEPLWYEIKIGERKISFRADQYVDGISFFDELEAETKTIIERLEDAYYDCENDEEFNKLSLKMLSPYLKYLIQEAIDFIKIYDTEMERIGKFEYGADYFGDDEYEAELRYKFKML